MKQARMAFVSGVVATLAFALPLSASAQAVVQTVQLLPPSTTNTCPVVTTQGIVAHIVDGAVHSFDVTIGNPTYIGISAQVGADSVPFNYMTRFSHGGGFVRHHVDLYTTPIGTGLPISLTLLSSPQGSPTCLTVVSFTVAPDGSIQAPGFTTTPAPSATTGGSVSTGKPLPVKQPSSGGTAGATTTTPDEEVGPGIGARIQGLCSGNSSTQLWFLLLAVYVVIAALTALARPPLAIDKFWAPLVAILVPLVLLLLFWYFAPMCRAGGWVPAVAIVIGIVALIVAFRDQESLVRVISLPAAKPSPNTPVVTKGAPVPATNPPKKAPEAPKK